MSAQVISGAKSAYYQPPTHQSGTDQGPSPPSSSRPQQSCPEHQQRAPARRALCKPHQPTIGTRNTILCLPFRPGLLGMELPPFADELQVPRARGVDAGHKCCGAARTGITNTKRTILQTERRISDGGDGHVVADTRLAGVPANASDDADLVLEGEAREGGLGLRVRLVPGQLCYRLGPSVLMPSQRVVWN